MAENNIKWSAAAVQQYEEIIAYILEDSVKSAEVFQQKIFNKLEDICRMPEIGMPDKYKLNNDGSYRAVIIYQYRLSYRYVGEEIRVLRIRHMRMKPRKF